jgi:protein-S-isoprenylcysteine O-methyltransferase Ste14
VLLLLILVNLPLAFLGYGDHVDTYGALDAGRRLLTTGVYHPSRNPGYLLFETAAAGLSMVGGYPLSNLATLAMGALAVWCFLGVTRELGVPHRHGLAAILILTPTFWVSCHTTTDFVWALACLLGAFLLLLRGRAWTAGVVLALAIGLRLGSLFPALCLLAFAFWRRPGDRRRLALAGVLALGLGGLCYLPPWAEAGYHLSFLQAHVGDAELWTPKMRLGRFVFKNIYWPGLFATAMLALFSPGVARALWRQRRGERGPVIVLCLAVLLCLELLFLQYPIRQVYLLPIVPFALILLGYAWEQKPRRLLILGALILSFNFVSLALARPDAVDRARSATPGLWWEWGYLAQSLDATWHLRGCQTRAQYLEAVHAPRPEP